MISQDKPIKVATFGDSLTQGAAPPNNGHPGKYQHFMMKKFESEKIPAENWNFGISGQIMCEIAPRIPNASFADVISISGGTNDFWRYSNFDEEMSADVREGVLEEMESAIDAALNGSEKKPIVILCSVPPVIPNKSATPKMLENIKIVRPEIEALAEKKGVYFCDIYNAMSDSTGQAKQGLVKPDGVHFTAEGNKVFGEFLANKIINIVRN